MKYIRRSRWVSFAAAFLLVAQFALALHELNPGAHNDAALGNDCAVCHFVSNWTAGDAPPAYVPPSLVFGDAVFVAEKTVSLLSQPTAGFRSRAPPRSV